MPKARSSLLVVCVVLLLAGCGRKTDPRVQEGYDLVVAGKVDEAIALANAILVAEPRHASAMNLLGLAFYKTGDAEGAIEQYRRALEVESDYPEAHFNLGNALWWLNRVPEAEAEFAEAVRLQDDFVLARYNLGKILQRTERVDQALAQYRRCVDVDPRFTPALIELGKILDGSGDSMGAVPHLVRALELEPGVKEVRVLLGNAYLKSGMENAVILAEEEFRAAVGIDPGYVDGLYSLGVLHATQGRQEEAVQWFERALAAAGEEANTQVTRTIRDFFREIGHEPGAAAASE